MIDKLGTAIEQVKTVESRIQVLLSQSPELGELKDVLLYLEYLRQYEHEPIPLHLENIIVKLFGQAGSSFKTVIRVRSGLGYPKGHEAKQQALFQQDKFFSAAISGGKE